MVKIITSLGTVVSIISPMFTSNLNPIVKYIIGGFGIICFIKLVIHDIRSQSDNEKICRSENEIKSTMKDLIKSQGKVCVMSRDLSWVDKDIEKCIIEKKDSVKIFVENEIELTKRLQAKGVQIKYYGMLGFEPKTRFTVIRYNRDNPQVAIANTENTIRKRSKFKHVIYETRDSACKQDKWINSLAVDMVTLCNIVFEGSGQVAKDSHKEYI